MLLERKLRDLKILKVYVIISSSCPNDKISYMSLAKNDYKNTGDTNLVCDNTTYLTFNLNPLNGNPI